MQTEKDVNLLELMLQQAGDMQYEIPPPPSNDPQALHSWYVAELGNYGPFPFVLCQDPDLGPIGTAIYVRVQGFARTFGKCTASETTIGREVGVTRQTAHKYLNILCAKNLLLDLTPSVHHKPHTYIDIGKMAVILKSKGHIEV